MTTNGEVKRLLLTPTVVARMLSLDECSTNPEAQVRKMARRGELVAVKVGRRTLIKADSVESFLTGSK